MPSSKPDVARGLTESPAVQVRKVSLTLLPWLGVLCTAATLAVAVRGDIRQAAVGVLLLIAVTLAYFDNQRQLRRRPHRR